MKIRKIDKNERLEILKGDLYAYSRWTNQDLPRSHLTAINPEDVLAAEIDGKIVAALQCFSFQQSLRGIIKPMGGIGGVWTYPEYRNLGCVKALMKSAFLEMRMRGICVSMLTPFKESFYENLGYAIANSLNEVTIPISALTDYLKLPCVANGAANWSCDRLPATEARDILINFLDNSLRSQTLQPHDHGVAITKFAYEQWWHLHRQKLCVVIKRDRQPVSIAIYAIDSSGNLPMSDRQIEISSIFWTDLESRDCLLNFFATHRDQIGKLKMPMPISANLHTWLKDAGKLSSTLSEPWMVRVVDIVEALHDLPIWCEPFTFALSDPYCSWNESLFGVSSNRGQLRVKRYNLEVQERAIDFRATIAGISALIYGTYEIEELVHKKWITDLTTDTYELLENSFTPCVIYNPFKF
ncbi:GNAT family N-acetyltransferase [Pseudanabaena sp. FACHB-1998]|uniref:GNAT family N-acetyltransferase n=1 Tax=Pseudanabaena sp. FACHB-1998 TaxID=2692858 RepID=UPI0016817D06|nr:GNAT family N-acetyltransferase [Pseudanabaena sp. FACHB-1998]MBD2178056.1 GNAT family N-acetyltransferase [Pseudanabaena sp. FACHB-1998]